MGRGWSPYAVRSRSWKCPCPLIADLPRQHALDGPRRVFIDSLPPSGNPRTTNRPARFLFLGPFLSHGSITPSCDVRRGPVPGRASSGVFLTKACSSTIRPCAPANRTRAMRPPSDRCGLPTAPGLSGRHSGSPTGQPNSPSRISSPTILRSSAGKLFHRLANRLTAGRQGVKVSGQLFHRLKADVPFVVHSCKALVGRRLYFAPLTSPTSPAAARRCPAAG